MAPVTMRAALAISFVVTLLVLPGPADADDEPLIGNIESAFSETGITELSFVGTYDDVRMNDGEMFRLRTVEVLPDRWSRNATAYDAISIFDPRYEVSREDLEVVVSIVPEHGKALSMTVPGAFMHETQNVTGRYYVITWFWPLMVSAEPPLNLELVLFVSGEERLRHEVVYLGED